jgi:exosortase/archaeosortase family protein
MKPNKPAIRRDSPLVVALLFAVLFGLFEAAIWGMFFLGQLNPLMTGTASLSAVLIGLVHIPASLSGIDITLPSRVLEIDVDCTAIQLAALYAALVIAYPVPPKTRLLGLIVGLPAIFVANLGRLLAVAVVSEHLNEAMFSFAHDFLFKVVMMLLIIGLWGWWLQTARQRASAS